jgi:hypothetical protein
MAAVELATAYLALVPSLEGASGTIGKELGGPAVQSAVGKAGDKAGKSFAGKFSSAGKLAAKGIGLGLLGAAAASGAWAASTVNDLANVQRIGALTESTIKATGGAAGRSRADIDQLAGSIEKMSGVEAETVTEGQNMLLTFKNIKGQRFDQATTAMTDMAVAMNKGSLEGLDMKAASIQLGKALNDPIKGVSALSKVGVSFTDQQKEQIKTMVEAGDVAGAQGVILDEMKAQFGGAAEAAGGTFQGNVAKLQNTLGNFSEGLLSGALPAVTSFVQFLTNQGVPMLERVGTWIKANVVPAVKEMSGAFREDVLPVLEGSVLPALGNLVGFLTDNWRIIGALVAGVLIYVAAMKAYAGVMLIVGGAQKVMAAGQIAIRGAMLVATAAQWAYNAALSANPIGLVVVAIAALVGALVWFFTKTEVGQKIVKAAWAGIKSAISGVSSWWTGTAWPAIRAAITSMGQFLVGLRDGAVAAWNGIRNGINTAWQWIDKNVFAKVRFGIAAVRLGFYLAGVGIGIIWSTMRNNLSAGWAWIDKNVFARFRDGIRAIRTAFASARDGIKSIWNGLKKIAADPVNFVINTVYMNGIRSFVGKIFDFFGKKNPLPSIAPVKFANGSEDHRAQIARGGAMRLWAEPETGGEAYIPLADSKRAGSTAILSKVAHKFGYSLSAYAGGGFFGEAADFLRGPVDYVKRGASNAINGAFGGRAGGVWDMMRQFPKMLVGPLADYAKNKLASVFGGGGGAPAGKLGWRKQWEIVQGMYPGARLHSAFRPGAVTAVGTPSYHGLGRAIDVNPSMTLFNRLSSAFPNATELIFSPANGRQIHNGRRTTFGEPTRGDHWDHIHWAMANGGILPSVYDQGGWMPPGGVGVNRGTRPEAVLDPDESRALKSGLGTAPLIGTLVAADMDEAVYKMQRFQRRAATRAGLAGMRG